MYTNYNNNIYRFGDEYEPLQILVSMTIDQMLPI